MTIECAISDYLGPKFFLFSSTLKILWEKIMIQSEPSVFSFFLGVLPLSVISLIPKSVILLYWWGPD